MSDTLQNILEQETLTPTTRVKTVCDAIMARHPGRVQAFLYYGSSLRDLDNPDKMLDFYVIVDSYRKTHKNILRAGLNHILPPAVYYYERADEANQLTTCKYSIISLMEFEKRCSSRAFLSVIWGRFSQPSLLLLPASDHIKQRVLQAREIAIRHIASQTAPLVSTPISALEFWAKGFRESYRTELRPERADSRSEEIVGRYLDRYTDLMTALYGPAQDGAYRLPPTSVWTRMTCHLEWFFRRLFGKITAALRILNSAATFDGGLDYVLRKLHNHSGVTIDVTPSQRSHPVLWAPVLAFKLWSKGAFR